MLTWYFFNYVKIGLCEKFFYIKWITFPYGIICLNFLPKKPLEYFICIVFIITVMVIFVGIILIGIILIIWWFSKWLRVIRFFIPCFYFDKRKFFYSNYFVFVTGTFVCVSVTLRSSLSLGLSLIFDQVRN